MKTKIFILATSLLVSTAAFAQPGNNGGGNGGCGVGQQTNGCGGNIGGAGGAGGSAIQGQAQGQIQGQAQGQLQGQAQSVRNRVSNRNTNVVGVRSSNRNQNANLNVNQNRNRNVNQNYNRGNNQTMNYSEARDRLQAPGVAASFSSVQGSPCEGVPFGIGGSGPGFGGLLQIPRQSGECWSERQAILLKAWGYDNAAIAVLAGNPVGVAVQNNPATVRRVIRAKN